MRRPDGKLEDQIYKSKKVMLEDKKYGSGEVVLDVDDELKPLPDFNRGRRR
jgi:hypothetical protein